MRRTSLPLGVVLAALLSVLMTGAASAATTGTICGQVTAFTTPTAVADGGLTLDGTAEVIDSSAFGAIDASTLAVLSTVATADATTCLEIEADAGGAIVDLAIAAQAEICGEVAHDMATDTYTVGGVIVPAGLVTADADLAAVLDAAATAGADLCANVTVDGTTGLITSVSLDGTLELCADVAADADSATIGGLDLPLTLLDAEAIAVLDLAADAGVDACVTVVVDGTNLVEANVAASVELCGDVMLDASGNATIDGVAIDAALLSADAAALLELAAGADGSACASVVASSAGGDTTVGVTVTIEACVEVTAITDETITLGDVTFVFAGAADADIAVGDTLCVAAGQAPTGDPVIIDPDTTDDDDGAGPGAGGGSGPLLPDTATSRASGSWVALVGVLLLIAASVLAIARRSAGLPTH